LDNELHQQKIEHNNLITIDEGLPLLTTEKKPTCPVQPHKSKTVLHFQSP
jgi:hypothetical protein